MTNIQNICVFASSSENLDAEFYKAASELGKLIALNGYNLVYGGSRLGLMYACAESVKKEGGKVCGIIPRKLADWGLANPEDCDEFYITEGMRERKALIDQKSEAVIALPGGYGTLEEISEMITQKQLGYSNKPLVILNTLNIYDRLLDFFDNIIQKNFAQRDGKILYYVASNPQDAIKYIQNYHEEKLISKFEIIKKQKEENVCVKT